MLTLLSNVYVHGKRQLWCMEDITNLQNTVWELMVTHILIIGCRIDSAPYTIMTYTVHRLNKRIKEKFKNSQRSVIYLLSMHSEPLLFTIKAALKDVSRFCSDIYDYKLNVPLHMYSCFYTV